MCQTLNILNVDVYLYHEKPLNLRGEMGNGPLRDRTRMGQGLRLPYGRRITILTLVGLDRDLETVFPAFDGDRKDRPTSCRDGSGAR